jgi:hypothetical protein
VGRGLFGLAIGPKLIVGAAIPHFLFAVFLWALCLWVFPKPSSLVPLQRPLPVNGASLLRRQT